MSKVIIIDSVSEQAILPNYYIRTHRADKAESLAKLISRKIIGKNFGENWTNFARFNLVQFSLNITRIQTNSSVSNYSPKAGLLPLIIKFD